MFRSNDHNDHRAIGAARLSLIGLLALLLLIMPLSSVADDKSESGVTDGVPSPNSDETLLLDVQINGQSIGKVGEFILRRGKLMARPDELRDLGFLVPTASGSKPGGLITLSDIPGLIWSLDLKNLELHITVSERHLMPTVLQPSGRSARSEHREIESGTGMTLNYDAVGSFSRGAAGGTGSLDVRAFSPLGIASSDWLGYAGATSGTHGSNTVTRLDSAYTFADVNSLRRYNLGDFISGGLSWTRPFHLGGAQINSDFSMRPDLITFPLPTISGSTAVPSTVDILADGNLMVASQVGAGPFEVPQLPVVSGAGTISMTVTNALGQQVTLTQPFYASSALLAPGLQTFAVQSGLVRRNWGSLSNDYGKVAGNAIYRRGLTSKFTVEGTVEGTQGTFLSGAGGVVQIGNLGALNFAGSASAASARIGDQLSLGAQRIGRVFSLGGSAIVADKNYRDVASINGDGVPRKQLSAFSSLYLRKFGSLGAAYAGIDKDAAPNTGQQGSLTAEHSHVVSASYSRQMHRVSVFVTGFDNLAGTGSNGVQFGVTLPFGRRSSVSMSASSDGSGQVQAQKSAALIGEWGYDAYVSAGNSNHEFGQVQYKSPVGLFTAGVDHSAGTTTMRIESQGALSWVDKGLFPSNTIYDSFAIVDTKPVPHVHVLQENRAVGRTSSSCRLLVPDMRSFDLNHIAITPTDIPPDVKIDVAAREMRPQDRSGVVVRFPVIVNHAALLQIVDAGGHPLPLGTSVTLLATGAVFPVGYDGAAYVESLASHNELAVERENGRQCAVTFDYKPIVGEIPSIGPLRCLEKRP
ncbi:fimbria/pilus outer membrane usher protein [Telmatobacter sp. DSM 110680]|uniref:Fimbria/pilus outer membrane usher protein n=1 Tax=Telmatobacter sp. DSM 110680 TaxID=3036704 RepID=A0AAU7DP78_9BACT